jgi:hypothetical protein
MVLLGYLLKTPPALALPTVAPAKLVTRHTVGTPPHAFSPGSILPFLHLSLCRLEHEISFWKSLTTTSVVPILDVRMDYADACHIGRSGNRFFLLFVDKTTEYVQNYNTRTRSNPAYSSYSLEKIITFTGKQRYLLRDTCEWMVPRSFTRRKCWTSAGIINLSCRPA